MESSSSALDVVTDPQALQVRVQVVWEPARDQGGAVTVRMDAAQMLPGPQQTRVWLAGEDGPLAVLRPWRLMRLREQDGGFVYDARWTVSEFLPDGMRVSAEMSCRQGRVLASAQVLA
ncbi:hypothetical protein ACWDYJ_33140 [Streptomyces sp. NPDC003042]